MILQLAVEIILIVEKVNFIHKNANKDEQNESKNSALNKSTCKLRAGVFLLEIFLERFEFDVDFFRVVFLQHR